MVRMLHISEACLYASKAREAHEESQVGSLAKS
jgi:hypothetical protein